MALRVAAPRLCLASCPGVSSPSGECCSARDFTTKPGCYSGIPGWNTEHRPCCHRAGTPLEAWHDSPPAVGRRAVTVDCSPCWYPHSPTPHPQAVRFRKARLRGSLVRDDRVAENLNQSTCPHHDDHHLIGAYHAATGCHQGLVDPAGSGHREEAVREQEHRSWRPHSASAAACPGHSSPRVHPRRRLQSA